MNMNEPDTSYEEGLPRNAAGFDLIRRWREATPATDPLYLDVGECEDATAKDREAFLRGAERYARQFAQYELRPSCRIAIDLPNSTDYLQCLVAIWHIKAIPMLLHGRWSDAMKDEACETFGCAIRVSWENGIQISQCPPSRASQLSHEDVELDAMALIFFTSGSTGSPSAVPVSFENLICSMAQFRQELDLNASRRVAAVAPLYHAAGLLTMTLPSLFLGAPILCVAASPSRSDEHLAKSLAHHAIDALFLVPTMWERLSRTNTFEAGELAGLRIALTGGARTPHRLLERWRARGVELIVGYGMTETAPTGTFARAKLWRQEPLSIGVAPPTMQLRLVQQDDQGIGRIAMKGDNISRGYLVQDEETGSFRLDRSSFDEDGFLISRDLAAWRTHEDEHGVCTQHLIFLGRCDDRIVSGGENISSLAVEAALEEVFPGHQWAVIGLDDELWGECVTACSAREHVHSDISLPSLGELRRLLLDRTPLASYMLPRQLFSIARFPLGSSGKIDRSALKRDLSRRQHHR